MITGLDMCHVLADRLDDAGRLVAHDHRRRVGIFSLEKVEIAVAQASRCSADQYLAATRLVGHDVLDDEVARDLMKNGGAHSAIMARQWMGKLLRLSI